MRIRKVALSILAVGLAGCVSLGGTQRSSPPPLPTSWVAYYQYTPLTLKSEEELGEARSGYEFQRLRLVPTTGVTDFRSIQVDAYRPRRPGRLPVVLISPILAGNDLYIKEFAKFYAARGLGVVIVYRPKEIFSADRELIDIESHLRESVVQMRQAIDWLQTLDWVDGERIGSFAISLGAILTLILAAVEPRVKASVLGLPAGNVPEIIMASQDRAIRKRRRAFLELSGWTEEEALAGLKQVIISEPIALAPSVNPRSTLMIAGLFDRVLGLRNSLALWRAMGKPQLILLPTGHYTAYFATPYLKIHTYSFLRRHLK